MTEPRRDAPLAFPFPEPPGPAEIIEVARETAPVQAVVLTGDEADLTALPVHLQHGHDGAPYISASMDVVLDRDTGMSNVGLRRLMLRGRREAGDRRRLEFGDVQVKVRKYMQLHRLRTATASIGLRIVELFGRRRVAFPVIPQAAPQPI